VRGAAVVTDDDEARERLRVEKRCPNRRSRDSLAMLSRFRYGVLEVGIHNVDTHGPCIAGTSTRRAAERTG